MMFFSKRTALCILLLTVVLGGLSTVYSDRGPVSSSRLIKYRYVLRNESSKVQTNIIFQCRAPVAGSPVGYDRNAVSASYPFDLVEESGGNRALVLDVGHLNPHAVAIVRIAVELEPNDSRDAEPTGLSDRSFFLGSSALVHPENEAVQSLALNLKRENPQDSVHEIRKWVDAHIADGQYIRTCKSDTEILSSHSGDCTERAVLVVSLCRALGIPARVVGGYRLPQGNVLLGRQPYHNWTECFVNGQWQIVDPGASEKGNANTYLAMQVWGAGTDRHPDTMRRRYHVNHDEISVSVLEK